MESKHPEQLLACNPGLCLKKKRLKVDLWCWIVGLTLDFSFSGGLMKRWCWRETQVFPLSTRAARVEPCLFPAWVRQVGHTQWKQVGQDLGAVSSWTENDILLIIVIERPQEKASNVTESTEAVPLGVCFYLKREGALFDLFVWFSVCTLPLWRHFGGTAVCVWFLF